MIKRIIFLSIWLIGISINAQVVLTVNGIDTTLVTTNGYDLDNSEVTTLTVTRNKFTTSVTSGYMLQCGTDGPTVDDNNFDNAVIWGNYFDYNGGSGTTHGMMAGYSINYDIKYNYYDNPPYGIVAEGGDGMTYTDGGIGYNIFKGGRYYSILVFGQNDVPIYNNTFYNNNTLYYFIGVRINDQYPPQDTTKNIKIKNNIFYSVNLINFLRIDSVSLPTLECDYNIYYCEAGDHNPQFRIDYESSNETLTWAEWRALGFDAHSQVIDPNFTDLISFIPSERLDYGVEIAGTEFDNGLATSSEWVVGTYPDVAAQDATWQVGAIVFDEEAPSDGAYYVAPSGSDSGTGTIDDPWATPNKAYANMVAGDTVYFRGGIYYLTTNLTITSKTGTAENPYCYFNYPGETPIFDYSTWAHSNSTSQRGAFTITSSSYIYVKGITLRYVNQIYDENIMIGFWGTYSRNIKYTNCTVHHIQGKGFRLYNCSAEIINCDAYRCFDPLRSGSFPGNGATGINVGASSTLSPPSDYYIFGCRAWENADQGFSGAGNGQCIYDSCWAWSNTPAVFGSSSGIGFGFKFGLFNAVGYNDYTDLTVRNSIAAYNKYSGFYNNGSADYPVAETFYNNTAYKNGIWGGFLMYPPPNPGDPKDITLKNNISYQNTGGDGLTGATINEYNNWNLGITLQDADFVAFDTLELKGARQSDGSLPIINFLQLSNTSQAINKGTNVGLAYTGSAPDLGAFEWDGYTVPPPLVSTTYPSVISSRSITAGGFIIEDYDEVITAKGICYNTTGTPTTADNTKSGGSGSDPFTVTISGLNANTLYYIRAYATTESGTGYGTTYEITADKWNWVKYGTKIVTHNGKPVIVR